ncbi:MAG TPA: transcriptional repressor [Cytophagaceae bacterium]|jgi:Fur family ferric uptake transcriptional regulator|nr:transcriptional repressor [Cytophagaceae bacterium]
MATEVERILQQHALKVTLSRVQMLTVFIKNKRVLAYSELQKKLGENFDRVTLYRTLQSFEEKGLIHTIPDQSGALSYALCNHEGIDHIHNDNHVHFKCNNCNLTLCLEDKIIPAVKLSKKLKPLKYTFLIEGLCENCN